MRKLLVISGIVLSLSACGNETFYLSQAECNGLIQQMDSLAPTGDEFKDLWDQYENGCIWKGLEDNSSRGAISPSLDD